MGSLQTSQSIYFRMAAFVIWFISPVVADHQLCESSQPSEGPKLENPSQPLRLSPIKPTGKSCLEDQDASRVLLHPSAVVLRRSCLDALAAFLLPCLPLVVYGEKRQREREREREVSKTKRQRKAEVK